MNPLSYYIRGGPSSLAEEWLVTVMDSVVVPEDGTLWMGMRNQFSGLITLRAIHDPVFISKSGTESPQHAVE